MRCKHCGKEISATRHVCTPSQQYTNAQSRTENHDNDFALGLATGIAMSPSGLLGAAIHDTVVSSSYSDTSSSSDYSSCDSSFSDSSCSSGDF